MSILTERKCFFILSLALVFFIFYRGGNDTHAWEVLLSDLPDHISVRESDISGMYYIIKQTYEPLFRKDDGQNYNSRLLTQWSRNLGSTVYKFCPDTSLRFNSKTPFSIDFFNDYLEAVTRKYYPEFLVARDTECVTIKFPETRTGFLDFLTQYENAPTIKISTQIEQGLGRFETTDMSKERIILQRKKPVRRGYNKIILHQYTGPGDPNLENRNISDFNKLLPNAKPQWVQRDYFEFSNVDLESANLFINHPDPKVRKFLYNCIDVDKFRKAFVPDIDSFIDLPTVLPFGIPGALSGRGNQKCGGRKEVPYFNGPIILADQSSRNIKQLLEFSEDFYRKTGRRIKIKRYAIQDLLKQLNNSSSRRPYTLVAGIIGTARPRYVTFFEHLCGDNNYYDTVPKSVNTIYKAMLKEDDPARESALATDLANELVNQSLVLTLFQTVKKFYYPHKIKNLIVGRGFLEYPEVGDFKW